MARIVKADNFDRDWVDEEFLPLPPMPEHACKAIVEILNAHLPDFWKVVRDDYKLRIFEP